MFEDISKVHFVGIGGIGVSAMAKLFLAFGKSVSGSDVVASDFTRDLETRGVKVFSGHSAEYVPNDADLVMYSAAIQESNPERQKAKELGIHELSYPQFLGEMSRQYKTIAVSGTNGKSTTTAMLGLILEAAGLDPTVIVGSLVPGFEMGNLRVGKGKYFVVEACEYRANMLNLEPEMIVLTNIEEDHLDFYRDIDHIRETFQIFVDKVKGRGLVVRNADDAESQKLVTDQSVTYGMKNSAIYTATGRHTEDGKQFAIMSRGEKVLGEFVLQAPGAFNVMNALAAVSAAIELGVSFEVCAKALGKFGGIWRRFERVGAWHGADVISDYGHHPTAIRETVEAAREFFPGRRIALCFQPHQHSRTEELLDELVEAIQSADAIVVPEIYKVVGRTEKEEKEVSSRDIVERVKKADSLKEIFYAEDLDVAEMKLREIIKTGDVLLIQGAGDVDLLARKLVL